MDQRPRNVESNQATLYKISAREKQASDMIALEEATIMECSSLFYHSTQPVEPTVWVSGRRVGNFALERE